MIASLGVACAAAVAGDPACTPDAGSCFVANGTPGCEQPDCCTHICETFDVFCCEVKWDNACAEAASEDPGNCVIPPPDNDDCNVATKLVLPVTDVPYSTHSANTDGPPVDPACLDGATTVEADIWYTFDHAGGQIFIASCGGDQGHDQVVVLYAGTCGDAEVPCDGDTDSNGVVGVPDLINVVTLWGTDGQGPGVDADLDDDGVVGVPDLIAVITSWGDCAPGGGLVAVACQDDGVSCGGGVSLQTDELPAGTYLLRMGGADGATGQGTFDVTLGGQCPGQGGDCCQANMTPGCDDVACCFIVCAVDPFCCNVEWDAVCAGEAMELCEGCP